MAPTDDARVIVEFDHRPGDGTVIRGRLLSVPVSESFEAGIKYSYHYGYERGETIVRYDNHHGVHERHTADGLDDDYEFPGYEAVEERFWEDVAAHRD